MEARYLYKAKRIDNGEWVIGYYFKSDFVLEGTCYIVDTKQNFLAKYYNQKSIFDFFVRVYEVDPSTICRCTGIRDKNGKMIWEKDVVKCQDLTGKVEWNITHLAFVILINNDGNMQYYYIDEALCRNNIEVIGNIFDNQELLEREDNKK